MLEIKYNKFPQLETDRLLLRQIQYSDVDAFHKMRTDPSLMKYMDMEKPKSIGENQE